MDVPETRYAKSGDVRVAYQVISSGPLDLVFVPGFVSNLDLMWENPAAVRINTRLSAFSRLIRFDKRGTGLSDRAFGVPTLEERMDDVRAVMDAVGSERAALLGIFEGGAMSMLFAATYPERTHALALYGAYAHYPTWVLSPDNLETSIEMIDRCWGTGAIALEVFAPGQAADAASRLYWGRFERLSASPSAAIALQRMNSEIDVRHILRSIRVPTLVLHQSRDPRVDAAAGRFLASQISGARYIELPGSDYLPMAGDTDCLADEIEEFLTGSRTPTEPDRVLATVLFTDIVDSTRRAAELGDRAWRALLDRHNEAVRQELGRFRGREVKTLGDGFLATFDGPARAVRCASSIIERVRPLGIEVRSGLHTGEIEIQRDDVAGIAVHIAARVAELAGSREVLVSSTVRDLVAGSGLRFHDRGSRTLRGLPEPLRLFAAEA